MRFILSIIVLAFLHSLANAQEVDSPETLRAANELAAIISNDAAKQMSREITGRVWAKLEDELKEKIDHTTVEEMRSEFDRLLKKHADEARKAAPALYARYFNAQELHDLIAFYRTPTGSKALEVMPKIAAEYTSHLMPQMRDFQSEFRASVDGILRNHGYKK